MGKSAQRSRRGYCDFRAAADLKTAGAEPSKEWQTLLDAADDKATRNGLSRLARWASLRQVTPAGIDDAVLERFFSELEAASLVRNIRSQRRIVAKVWNKLVALFPTWA